MRKQVALTWEYENYSISSHQINRRALEDEKDWQM